MGQRAKWALPNDPHPPTHVDFCVEVPDDPLYIAAFIGAIYELSKPYAWQNDPAHTALQAGAEWLAVFNKLKRNSCVTNINTGSGGDDMARLRQSPTNPCLLEQECLPDQWVTLFDVSKCLNSNPGQPSPGGPGPTPGTSRQDCFKLSANGKLLLPYPVSSGDTISVSNLAGGWNDGTISWYCPDGSGFGAGFCVAGCGHAGGDPLGTACHMALIMSINGVFYDATQGPVVVPPGLTNVPVVFQANDGTLNDDSGEISFCVITANEQAPTFDHVFNFATNTGGLNSDPRSEGPGCPAAGAVYTPGTGWTDYKCPSIGATYININRTMAARQITDMTFTVNLSANPTGASDMEVFLVIGGVETLIQTDSLTVSGDHVFHVTGSWVATAIRIRIGIVSDAINAVLKTGEVKGVGTDPF